MRRGPTLGHDRCDAECPRCRRHAEFDGEVNGKPYILSPTAKGDSVMEMWMNDRSSSKLAEIEVEFNLYCPRCRIAWVGTLMAALE